jgi:hypothetical protein
LTLGYDWKQTTVSQSTNGDITTVRFSGKASYSLFFEGLGIIGGSIVEYSIDINNKSGKIISGKRLPIKQ